MGKHYMVKISKKVPRKVQAVEEMPRVGQTGKKKNGNGSNLSSGEEQGQHEGGSSRKLWVTIGGGPLW